MARGGAYWSEFFVYNQEKIQKKCLERTHDQLFLSAEFLSSEFTMHFIRSKKSPWNQKITSHKGLLTLIYHLSVIILNSSLFLFSVAKGPKSCEWKAIDKNNLSLFPFLLVILSRIFPQNDLPFLGKDNK